MPDEDRPRYSVTDLVEVLREVRDAEPTGVHDLRGADRKAVRAVKRTPGKTVMAGLALIAALGTAGGAIYGACMGSGVLVEQQVKHVLVRSSLICPELDPAAAPTDPRYACKTLAERVGELRDAQDAQAEAQRDTNAKLDAVLRRLPPEAP